MQEYLQAQENFWNQTFETLQAKSRIKSVKTTINDCTIYVY